MTRLRKFNKSDIIKRIINLQKELGRRPVKRDSSTLYQITRRYFGSWNNALKASGFEVKYFQKIRIPDKLNSNLSYFTGIVITDGHLVFNKNDRNYCIKIYTSYEEEKEIILTLIKILFDYNPTIRKRKYGFNKRFNFEIIISSKLLTEYINKIFGIPYGPKSLKVRAPNIFFRDKENAKHFIRGVMDGDGSIGEKNIGLSSGSYKFLKDIKELLENFNIGTTTICKSRSGSKTVAMRVSKKYLINLYRILYSDAKFYYPRKKEIFYKRIKPVVAQAC